jgi:LacI family transcriptional regulator
MGQKPTIGLVAKRAGVSVASVSRVINGTLARPNTERRVRAAIEELSYHPNSAARALKVRASEQICLSFADVGNPAYLALTRGISRVMKDSKYRIVLSTSVSNEKEIAEHLQGLGSGYADGLIISPIVTNERITELLKELRVPTVLIGTLPPGIKIDNVSIDSNKGIEMAVAHLKETGRKKVAFINGPLATNPGKRRNLGFIAAMEKYKLKISEGAITFLSDFTSEAAIEGLKTADSLKKFDSIICANDLIAAGVIKILLESNMDVGPEIAVIGMDNTELGKILTPSLTSIDLLAEKRGEVAARLLLERMNDGQIPPRKVELKSTIVIRDSSRI